MPQRQGRPAVIFGFALLFAVVCGSPGSAMAEEGTVICPICSRANEESADYPTTDAQAAARVLRHQTPSAATVRCYPPTATFPNRRL